jgi:hypothetical protein
MDAYIFLIFNASLTYFEIFKNSKQKIRVYMFTRCVQSPSNKNRLVVWVV